MSCATNSVFQASSSSEQKLAARAPAQTQAGLSSDICYNSLLDRSIWSIGRDKKEVIIKIDDLINQKYSTSFRQQALDKAWKKDSREILREDWYLTLNPLTDFQYPVAIQDFPRYVKELRKLPIGTSSFSENSKTCLMNQSQIFETGTNTKQNAILILACGKLAPGDAIKCQKAVSYLYKNSAPSTLCGSAITYPQIWSNFLSDSKYYPGIKLATDKLSLEVLEKNVQSPNLLTLLLESYKKSKKFGSEEAESAAWETLAIIANGAQNTDVRLNGMSDVKSLDQQMSFLSHSAGIIDFENIQTPSNSFSFPPEIVGSCLTTKPYHFWMGAFQARELRKSGYSPREAMMAVLMYAKAYNTQGEKGNERLALIFEKPWNHPTLSVIRHDLILNILGSAYGAGLLEGKKINIETIFNKVFETRPKIAELDYKKQAIPLAENRMKAYLYWDKVFVPDAIFKIVENEIRSAK